jgi:hypothetical protein
MRITRAFIAILLAPYRLIMHMLRSPAYQDKVFYYTISPVRIFRPAQAGKPPFKALIPLQGGGFYSAGDKVLLDSNGEGGGTLTQNGDDVLAAGMGDGRTSGGVMLRIGESLRIYPLVGVGSAGHSIQQIKGEGNLSTQTISVQRSGGIGVEYRIGGRFGVVVGFRVGGVQSFFGGSTEPRFKLLLGVGRFGK